MVARIPALSMGAPHRQDFDLEASMKHVLRKLWHDEEGQDIAEYAVMLSIIVMIAIATVRFIGSGADNTFSAIASTIR